MFIIGIVLLFVIYISIIFFYNYFLLKKDKAKKNEKHRMLKCLFCVYLKQKRGNTLFYTHIIFMALILVQIMLLLIEILTNFIYNDIFAVAVNTVLLIYFFIQVIVIARP